VRRIERRSDQSPAARLLSVIDACTHELLGLPAYYRSLLQLLYRAESADQERGRVDHAHGAELAEALGAVAAAGELVAWAEPRALLRSQRALLFASALQWASGALSDRAFPAAARYDACLTLLGVTTGESHHMLAQAARAAQRASRARAGSGPRARTGRA
jgi:hypothetical protein